MRLRYVFTKQFVIALVFTLLGGLVIADREAAEKLTRGDGFGAVLRAVDDLGGRWLVATLFLLVAALFFAWWWQRWVINDGRPG